MTFFRSIILSLICLGIISTPECRARQASIQGGMRRGAIEEAVARGNPDDALNVLAVIITNDTVRFLYDYKGVKPVSESGPWYHPERGRDYARTSPREAAATVISCVGDGETPKKLAKLLEEKDSSLSEFSRFLTIGRYKRAGDEEIIFPDQPFSLTVRLILAVAAACAVTVIALGIGGGFRRRGTSPSK